jgi:hypothetical protein
VSARDAQAEQIAAEIRENLEIEKGRGEGKGRRGASPAEEGTRPYGRDDRD